MTRLNSAPSSPPISKIIPMQYPSRTKLEGAGPFTPYDENFLDEDDDDYTSPLSTTEPLPSSPHVNKSPQSVSKEPQPFIRCVQVTPPSTSLHADIPHQISFDVSGQPLPFIRPPFPAPMLDRSPIQGLNSRTVLRTCFPNRRSPQRCHSLPTLRRRPRRRSGTLLPLPLLHPRSNILQANLSLILLGLTPFSYRHIYDVEGYWAMGPR